MKVEYTKRAVADLREIAAYYTRSGDTTFAERVGEAIQDFIAGVAEAPLLGRPVAERTGVRVRLLVR